MRFLNSIIWTAALALAGCSSLSNLTRVPDVRHDAGVAPAPDKPWVPPADAIPPPPPAPTVVLPEGITAGGPVTLTQIIDVALANNPDTRGAWLNARAAQAVLGSEQAAYLPEIDVNATASLSQSAAGSQSTSRQTTIAPSVSLSYLLFDFGGRASVVEQARQALIAADFLHNQSIQDVVLRAEQAYYSYLDAKALLSAQEATLKERQAELDVANGRHEAGVATIADVLQARTALSQARLTRDSIEGNLRTIEGQLATVMGLPATTRFDFGELPSDVPTRVTDKVDALIARALTDRPDLAAARADAERARVRVQEVRAQGLPTISLNSSLGQSFSTGGNHTTPFSAGVSLHFPLFTGWRNTYDIRAAEAEAGVAAERVRAVAQDVNLQVWTSYFALQTATTRLTTVRDLLKSAAESAEVAHGRYRAGVGGILELLTAQAALETARAEEVQARADWFLAVAQLAHDTGSLDVSK